MVKAWTPGDAYSLGLHPHYPLSLHNRRFRVLTPNRIYCIQLHFVAQTWMFHNCTFASRRYPGKKTTSGFPEGRAAELCWRAQSDKLLGGGGAGLQRNQRWHSDPWAWPLNSEDITSGLEAEADGWVGRGFGGLDSWVRIQDGWFGGILRASACQRLRADEGWISPKNCTYIQNPFRLELWGSKRKEMRENLPQW